MILSQLQKDVEQVQACLAKGNLDEAETMLELVLMDIKNAQQGVQADGAYWACKKCNSIVNVKFDVCGLCKSPRR